MEISLWACRKTGCVLLLLLLMMLMTIVDDDDGDDDGDDDDDDDHRGCSELFIFSDREPVESTPHSYGIFSTSSCCYSFIYKT